MSTPRTAGSRLRRRDLAGLAAGALLLAAGAWFWTDGREVRADVGTVPAAPATTPPTTAPEAAPGASPGASPSVEAAGASRPSTTTVSPDFGFEPTGLAIPAIDMDSPVVPVQVDPDGVLGVPEDPAVMGWWDRGAKPGTGRGTVVIDGHIDSREYGVGPLRRADELEPGDTASVVREDGETVEYVVTGVRTYTKTELPYAELFRRDVPERLLVITCGGEFRPEVRSWDSNIVVFLEPA